jgi:secondary thiamine-phosphate synthase enzyme
MVSAYITLSIRTNAHNELKDITHLIQQEINNRRISEGLCVVYVPHTTAGVTINENADPDVKTDIINTLRKIVPHNLPYRHIEGNSPGHVKASLLGSSVTVPVRGGALALGTWQGIFFAEFDGPRSRKVDIYFY